ncbi:MAG: hypothetical protein AB8B56_17070 [Crocinitomicaceae bacterium]
MKSIALILPAALFLVASCTGEVTEENILNDLVDEVQEEMDANENGENEENTVSLEVPEGSQAWDKFVATYDEDYDMVDGNTSLDGTEVTLTGIIEKVENYTDSDGNQYAKACFGVTDDMMGKCQLSALFGWYAEALLTSAKEEGTALTFKGTVNKKKFGEITINPCEMSE